MQMATDTNVFLVADSAGASTRELTLSYTVEAYSNALGLAGSLATVDEVVVETKVTNANVTKYTHSLAEAWAGRDVSAFLRLPGDGAFVLSPTQVPPVTQVVTPTASPVTVAFDDSQILIELEIKSSGAPLNISAESCTFTNEEGTCFGGANNLFACDPDLPNGGTGPPGPADCSVPDLFGGTGTCERTDGASITLPATIP
jgi:hypothetical protein